MLRGNIGNGMAVIQILKSDQYSKGHKGTISNWIVPLTFRILVIV